MRLRARYMHHLEVLSDNIVGIVINYWMVYFLLNAFGIPVTHGVNTAVTGIIFVTSYIRKYFFRRFFSNWIGKMYETESEEIQEQAGKE